MSQVAKTKFIAFAFIFSTSLLSGCGISGPLYMPGSAADPDRNKSAKVAEPTVESTESIENESKTSSDEE